MPRTFNRVINFHVKGEIYADHETTPESIIRNYNWSQKDVEGDIHLIGRHKDSRGRINKMIPLPKIHLWKQPESELFLNL